MHDEVNRLLGLEGFRVTAVEERGGALEVEVELVARAAVCPHCGRGSVEVKERPVVGVRDLSISGRWTWLRWFKRRFACQACRRACTEAHPELPPRRRVTRRFDRRLFVLARGGAAHAEIARNEGTSRYHVDRAFRAGATGELAARPRAWPRRISLDEAHHRRGAELATIVSDVDERRVVEVVDGRSRRRIERYLRSLPDERRNAIEVVSIDPYEAYRQAVQTVLPDAVIVCDPFHLVRGANTALDTVRRERQRVAKSERGKGARRAGRTIWKRELYQAATRC